MFASTIVFAALVATAQAEQKWEVVTSEEGRFAVELPACAEQSGATPIIGRGMSGTLHDSIRQTDGMTFQVMWYEARSPIPKADEARWLDFVRDQKAGPGGCGKLLSEKKMKLGAIEGREYVYMDELGSKTETRARAFVKGNSAILLLVSSSRGGPLVGADAGRFLDSFTFDAKPSTARKSEDTPPKFDRALLLGGWEVVKGQQMPIGATLEFGADGQFRSIPNDQDSHFVAKYKIKGDELTLDPNGYTLKVKELTPTRLVLDGFIGLTECRRKVATAAKARTRAKAKAETSTFRGWGTPVDPDGDVTFEPSGKSLTILIPPTPHVLSAEIDKFNAPRVVAPTRGDFVATVRVDGGFDPSRESTTKKISSRQAGGLLLWKDEANHIFLQRRAVVGKEGKTNRQVIFDEREAGRGGDGHNQPAPDGPIFLRLERKKGRISAAFSADGKDWKSFKPIDASWAEGTVEVGVMAVNTSAGPHRVTFEDYLLKAK